MNFESVTWCRSDEDERARIRFPQRGHFFKPAGHWSFQSKTLPQSLQATFTHTINCVWGFLITYQFYHIRGKHGIQCHSQCWSRPSIDRLQFSVIGLLQMRTENSRSVGVFEQNRRRSFSTWKHWSPTHLTDHFSLPDLLQMKNPHSVFQVKARQHNDIKQHEANRRLAVMRSKGTRTAARMQRKVSLVGDGSRWRITNWHQLGSAMSKWA